MKSLKRLFQRDKQKKKSNGESSTTVSVQQTVEPQQQPIQAGYYTHTSTFCIVPSSFAIMNQILTPTLTASGSPLINQQLAQMSDEVLGTRQQKKAEPDIPKTITKPLVRVWNNHDNVRSRHILLDDVQMTLPEVVNPCEGTRDGDSRSKVVPTPITPGVAEE